MYPLTSWFCLMFIFGWVYAAPDALLLLNSRALTKNDVSCNESLGMNQGCNADCTGLQMCIQGQLITMDCKAQTSRPYCNQTTRECVSTPVLCPALPGTFKCPYYGIFPDPLDCTLFHFCDGFNPTSETRRCINAVFSPTVPPTCDLNGICYVFSTASYGLCHGKVGKLVGHPKNPSLFVKCNTDYPILGECLGKNIQFDSESLSCQYKCPSSGLFPHAKPNLYYICTKDATGRYMAKVEECPASQTFCEIMNTCI
ncbi:hypothetical protein CBL_09312 [Carabus blaptoides fortunei]